MFRSISISVILCSVLLMFCSCGKTSVQIKRMQAMEEGVANPTTPEEFERAIKKYQNRVADIESANAQIGIWYKILGTRYLDKKMYKLALESFQKATEYYPVNQNLYYYVGVCAGYMAAESLDYKATGSYAQRINYLKLAESAYLQAIKLDARYTKALYGLGVLYIFELDESYKAIEYLERLLTIDTKNIDGMFALARAYYSTYQFENAISMYEKIISTTKSDEKRSQAEANKREVLNNAGYKKN